MHPLDTAMDIIADLNATKMHGEEYLAADADFALQKLSAHSSRAIESSPYRESSVNL